MKTRSSTANPKVNSGNKKKGKGRATQWDSDDDDDDDDDAYHTSNDFVGTPEPAEQGINGDFRDVSKYDDEELYR